MQSGNFALPAIYRYEHFMEEIEISEKLLAMAEAAGLNLQQLQELLSGQGEVPYELKDVFEKVADLTSELTSDSGKK